ncbi:MAG: glutathione S-transferase N-terminal domain-containing protein [Pseudomonadota bacterium]
MLTLTKSPSSPFVRKARVVALETGVADQVTLVDTDPWNPDDPLPDTNPLGKVPALVDGEGQVFAGSTLICEYLDSLHNGRKVIPESGPERWRVLRLHAMADGVMEAAVARIIEEMRRPKEFLWPGWIDRQTAKITRTLDVLEAEAAAGRLQDPPLLGEIALACALGYLDFRFAVIGWRDGRPALTAWAEGMASRPSLVETKPYAPQ